MWASGAHASGVRRILRTRTARCWWAASVPSGSPSGASGCKMADIDASPAVWGASAAPLAWSRFELAKRAWTGYSEATAKVRERGPGSFPEILRHDPELRDIDVDPLLGALAHGLRTVLGVGLMGVRRVAGAADMNPGAKDPGFAFDSPRRLCRTSRGVTGRALSPDGPVLRARSRLGPEQSGSSLAVACSNPDLRLGTLPVDIPGHQAQRQQLHAMHPGLDMPSALISTPSSPDRTSQVSHRLNGLVPVNGGCVRGFPRLGVSARWYDGLGVAGGTRVVALARVASAVVNDACYAIMTLQGRWSQSGSDGFDACAAHCAAVVCLQTMRADEQVRPPVPRRYGKRTFRYFR